MIAAKIAGFVLSLVFASATLWYAPKIAQFFHEQGRQRDLSDLD